MHPHISAHTQGYKHMRTGKPERVEPLCTHSRVPHCTHGGHWRCDRSRSGGGPTTPLHSTFANQTATPPTNTHARTPGRGFSRPPSTDTITYPGVAGWCPPSQRWTRCLWLRTERRVPRADAVGTRRKSCLPSLDRRSTHRVFVSGFNAPLHREAGSRSYRGTRKST